MEEFKAFSDWVIVKRIRPTLLGGIYHVVKDNDVRALKISDTARLIGRITFDGSDLPEQPQEEAQILATLSQNGGHPHVIRLYDSKTVGSEMYMLLEYGSSFDMFDMVKNSRYLSEARASNYFRQMLLGLQFIHNHGIAHLDISLENISLTTHFPYQVKFVDFGQSRRLIHTLDDDKHKEWNESMAAVPFTGVRGKDAYMAPEVYDKQSYDGRKADIFSMGVCLCIMLMGSPPFTVPNKYDARYRAIVLEDDLKGLVTRWGHEFSNEAIEILSGMLCLEAQRWPLSKLLAHPWIQKHNVSESGKDHVQEREEKL